MLIKHINTADESYIPVPVAALVVGSRLPCNFFLKDRSVVIPLFSKDMLFTQDLLQSLRAQGIATVLVKTADASVVDEYRARVRKPATTDTTAFKDYSWLKEQHVQLDVALLLPGRAITCTLFSLSRQSIEAVLTASPEAPAVITPDVLSRSGDIVIRQEDIGAYGLYLCGIEADEPVASRYAGELLRERSKIVLRELFKEPRDKGRMRLVAEQAVAIAGFVAGHPGAVQSLSPHRSFDFYLYTHCVNVAFFSVALGDVFGLLRYDLEALCLGAIVHDIGGSVLPHELLNRQGRLSSFEYEIVKRHVAEGEKILRDHGSVPLATMEALLQHHERLTGRGYPQGLKGDEIGPFGRIVAIADAYDALTTPRPYRAGLRPFDALMRLKEPLGAFDDDLLRGFISLLSVMGKKT